VLLKFLLRRQLHTVFTVNRVFSAAIFPQSKLTRHLSGRIVLADCFVVNFVPMLLISPLPEENRLMPLFEVEYLQGYGMMGVCLVFIKLLIPTAFPFWPWIESGIHLRC
jgi:hypothetical protein